MAQYNITIDSEILHYLFLKGVKDEGMTKLLESVLNQVLQAQAIMIPKIKTDKTAQIS